MHAGGAKTQDACDAGYFQTTEMIMRPVSHWIMVCKAGCTLSQASQYEPHCTGLANTILSKKDMQEPFQLPWSSSSWNVTLLNKISNSAVKSKAYCLYCLAVHSLHHIAAVLTPVLTYPGSVWRMQQLRSWSESWCSAGGKGYQTAGILARLTRLCTLISAVKTAVPS